MKTTSIISAITMAFLMLISINTNAQEFPGLDKSPMDAASYPSDYKEATKDIKIVYSRPQLNDRSLKELAPMGKVWRTGANEAAEITFYRTMKVGDAKIDAGTYTFYLIPGEQEWTAIISTDLNVWGSYFYDEKNDVVRTTIAVKNGAEPLEAFSIAFEKAENGANMRIGWGKTRLTIPFSF